QLDAHEHDDRVPPDQHPDGADREQQRGQDQVVRRVHSPLPLPAPTGADPSVKPGPVAGSPAVGSFGPPPAGAVPVSPPDDPSPGGRSPGGRWLGAGDAPPTRPFPAPPSAADGPPGSIGSWSAESARAYTPGPGRG